MRQDAICFKNLHLQHSIKCFLHYFNILSLFCFLGTHFGPNLFLKYHGDAIFIPFKGMRKKKQTSNKQNPACVLVSKFSHFCKQICKFV